MLLCYHTAEEGGADREEAYRRFPGNFEAGNMSEIAEKTHVLINSDRMRYYDSVE